MKNLNPILLVTLLFCSYVFGQAQSDGTTWNSLQLKIPMENGYGFAIKPTLRTSNDYVEYDNFSLDLTLSKKLSDHWTAAFLIRPWWMQENRPRFFTWPIMVYNRKFGKINFKSRFMWHNAINLEGNDPDFLRIRPEISHPLSDKMSAAVAIEPFFLLNDVNEVSRTRYEVAIGYKFTPQLNLNLKYWFEDQHGVWDGRTDFNTLLTTLTYVLKPKPRPGE